MIRRGYFTSDATNKFLELDFDVSWIKIINETKTATATNAKLTSAYWQKGMTYGVGNKRENTIDAIVPIQLDSTVAIEPFNSATDSPLSAVDTTITAVSTDAPPRVTLTSTAGMSTGDIVRMRNVTGAGQLNGMDFTVTVVSGTRFDLAYMATLTVAGTTGAFYKVKHQDIFAPRARFISAITQATSAVITMTVAHGYETGDYIRLWVPEAFGMKEANGQVVKITATSTSTITVDLDTTGYTAFAFPLVGALPLDNWAKTMPVSQVVTNVAKRGIILPADTATNPGPAGTTNDVIHWIAGSAIDQA